MNLELFVPLAEAIVSYWDFEKFDDSITKIPRIHASLENYKY